VIHDLQHVQTPRAVLERKSLYMFLYMLEWLSLSLVDAWCHRREGESACNRLSLCVFCHQLTSGVAHWAVRMGDDGKSPSSADFFDGCAVGHGTGRALRCEAAPAGTPAIGDFKGPYSTRSGVLNRPDPEWAGTP
jgi:hypothetical protein